MERPVRKSVRLPASLITREGVYQGYIINISASGVGMFIDTHVQESTIGCSQGSILTVEFTFGSGELIALWCRICWLRIISNADNGITTSMGMEVIDPPPGFVNMYHSLL
ncbi:MAG: PilZ domain-containing protein [Nitrospiraceae bacterium]|nr:MAG: PilZ domain-containing protein [Nitrospiraceae bacterium]